MNMRLVVYASALLGASAWAADGAGPTTNSLAGIYVRPDAIRMPERSDGTIQSLFARQMAETAPAIGMDRLVYSRLVWTRKSWDDGYAYIPEWNRAGRDAMRTIALSSLRETAVRLPGIEERQDFLTDLLKGTVGNTDEERLGAAGPAATVSEIGWKRWAKSNGISYGLRPFDMRPYLYGGFAWKDSRGRALLYDNARLRYIAPDGMRIEDRMIVPLSSSWQISLGAGCDPWHMDGKSADSVESIGLSKIVGRSHLLSAGWSLDKNGRGTFILFFSMDL